jgi:hypothetical protein
VQGRKEEDVATFRIIVTREADGFRFLPVNRGELQKISPVQVAKSLFISYDTESAFTQTYGIDMLVSQIPILFSGLSAAGLQSKGYNRIEYIDPQENLLRPAIEL